MVRGSDCESARTTPSTVMTVTRTPLAAICATHARSPPESGELFISEEAEGGFALANPPSASSLINSSPDSGGLRAWVAQMAASGVRVTVITVDGVVLADSQSDPRTMENHSGRPEIRDAFARGDG